MIAKHLADNGKIIWLQKESTADGEKSADGFVLAGNRVIAVEFKRLSDQAVNFENGLSKDMRDANKKAEVVVIFVDRIVNQGEMTAIRSIVILKGIRADNITLAIIVWRNGAMEELATDGT